MPLRLQQSEKELAVGGRVVLGIFQLLVKNRGHLFQAQILQQLLSFFRHARLPSSNGSGSIPGRAF